MAVHVAHTRGINMHTVFFLVGGNLKERKYKEDLGVDGRIILKWVLKKYRIFSNLIRISFCRFLK
jgi:hypothetical protein